MLAGDGYNKPGSHIVLWDSLAGNGAPIFFEASGSASKVRLNTAATWSYLSGYKPIRFEGVWDGEGPPPGGLDNPIVIDSFPFYDERSTQQSSSLVFDAYSCAPETGESGPEIVGPEADTLFARQLRGRGQAAGA